MFDILKKINADYLLVNSTNEYLVEYSDLSENARYDVTGFTGSVGDALITRDIIYLFVDGRYHQQADNEVKSGIKVVHLKNGVSQDNEIIKLIADNSKFAVVSKKVSQLRLENFKKNLGKKNVDIVLLENDLINNNTVKCNQKNIKINCKPRKIKMTEPCVVTNPEEVSYLTGLRNFEKDYSSKIYAKLFIDNDDVKMFTSNKEFEMFINNYDGKIIVDKATINAYDYSLIKNPVHKKSVVKEAKSVKTKQELECYKKAFENTDKTMSAIRNFINENEGLSEYDIAQKLRQEFIKYGAKNLSFKSIVAINRNSALAHYSKNSKDIKLKNGDIVLIDCGAYYENGYATDITRVFVKGEPSELQKKVYTTVLKVFLNCYNAKFKTGAEYDELAHKILDNAISGFSFSHGLGHGIGINVHENPPMLNKSGKSTIKDNMTFTIEPGLYNSDYFGVRLENSCYKSGGEIHSFVTMGFERKLIKMELLTEQEKKWLKEFKLL